MRASIAVLALLPVATPCLAGGPPPRVFPVVGKETRYTVRRGETLYRISRKRDLGVPTVARLNGIGGLSVKPGATLLLPTVHILPAQPADGIVLNIPERAVYVFRGGRLVGRHAVAVGRPSWQTGLGSYTLRSKAVNPTWHPPASLVEREGVHNDPVPPGPDNPLGDRWMGWSSGGYGFHSTNSPRSIGKAASHGCVRLYPEWAHAMFDQVRVGMPIYSLYKPVLVGKRDGRYYLSVFDDIYSKGGASLDAVQKTLDEAGLLPLADEQAVKRAVARRDGYPVAVVGEPEKLEVEGKVLETTVAPARARDRWVVPARPVVEALGGKVAPDPDGGVTLSIGTRSLTVKPRETAATVDGASVELPIAPASVEGTLMVPLRSLCETFGLQFEHGADKVLRITAAPVAPTVPAPGAPTPDAQPRTPPTGPASPTPR